MHFYASNPCENLNVNTLIVFSEMQGQSDACKCVKQHWAISLKIQIDLEVFQFFERTWF